MILAIARHEASASQKLREPGHVRMEIPGLLIVVSALSATTCGSARESQKDDGKMPSERMTTARLAKELKGLSERVEAGFAEVDARFAQVDARFAQVDERFAQVDDRFVQQRQEIHSDLEAFARRIEHAFKVSLEGMEAKLDAALDDTREQKRRLDVFEHTNAEEHRLMQTQIQDLDVKLRSRRSRRRPS